MTIELLRGDCIERMRDLPCSSVDSIVTDPPYGLSFMGKAWDKGVPGVEVWAECLRVLKPGGHLLAFAGTRTQHRMATAIEDAGFEIRDMIAWVYGSGFPKSLNVSKAIDKCNGDPWRLLKFTAWMRTTGLKSSEIDRITETNMGGHYLTAASQPAIPTAAIWAKLRQHCGDVPQWVDELVDRIEAEREVVGSKKSGIADKTEGPRHTIGASRAVDVDITTPATDAAKQWDGWGTALKPSTEPITVARKPFRGTVAANVLEHGTGAINVDGCRVATEDDLNGGAYSGGGKDLTSATSYATGVNAGTFMQPQGRWPANLIHDGSDEATAGMGEASRYFYCTKASKKDRGDDNTHPTVKPTDLMRYLCRLVTPPGGTVLDPFMGSGSTGKAAVLEGFSFIGIELDPGYFAIAERRIKCKTSLQSLL